MSFPDLMPHLLEGERLDLFMQASITQDEGAALAFYRANNEKDCVVLPCSLGLSQYRFLIGPAGAMQPITIPLLSIDKWSISRGVGPLAATVAGLRSALLQADQRGLPGSTSGPEGVASGALFAVTLHSKSVWSYIIVLQSERAVKHVKMCLTLCGTRLALVEQLPAFEYARARERAMARDPSSAAASHERVEFGWCLYQPRREFARQLTALGAERSPAPATVTQEDVDTRRVGVGVDLRPWFRLHSLSGEAAAAGAGHADPAAGNSLKASHVNECGRHYSASPTYPWVFLEPCAVSADTLLRALAGRSRSRIPAISYVHLLTGAVLARASQPLMWSSATGFDSDVCRALMNSGYTVAGTHIRESRKGEGDGTPTASRPSAAHRSSGMPSLFDDDSDDDDGSSSANASSSVAARYQSPRTSDAAGPSAAAAGGRAEGATKSCTLFVADCRPYVAAEANAQTGGGYETGPLYYFANTKFFGIDNVFGVAKSFAKLRALLANFEGDTSAEGFHKALHDTHWLQHIQRVFECSVVVARSLERGESCLVHCTDGWDRTAQCCATAMLMLDPFYRTTAGFCILLEKEFCSFGHKMAERSGHRLRGRTSFQTHSGNTCSDTEQSHQLQVSPIFLQYMDVVFQVLHQYPYAFEFTDALLSHLAEAVYSCLYGTFLCDNEQERTLEGVRLRTASIWTDVLRRVQREKSGLEPLLFVNPDYDAATAWRFISRQPGGGFVNDGDERYRIVPSCCSKRLVFWESHYLKFDSDLLCMRGAVDGVWRNVPTFSNDANSGREARRQTVSWGAEFDAYLLGVITDACQARLAEEPWLQEVEQAIASQPAHTLPRGTSNWCTVGREVCFGCYKPLSMWVSKSKCQRCNQLFCSDCTRHDCSAALV